MLLYDSLNLIISEVHQSHLGCWGHRSEKVKLRGLDNVNSLILLRENAHYADTSLHCYSD